MSAKRFVLETKRMARIIKKMNTDRKEKRSHDHTLGPLMLRRQETEEKPAQEEEHHSVRSEKNWGSAVSWEPNGAPREQREINQANAAGR